jgi:Mor transcription activator family
VESSSVDPWENAPERFLLGRVYHEVAAVIGWAKAVELGHFVCESKCPPSRPKYGRAGVIYFPSNERTDGATMATVSRIIGEEAVQKMIRVFGCERLQFPSIEAASIPRRNRAIVEQLINSNFWTAGVAASFDLTSRAVRRIFQQETGRTIKEYQTCQAG